MSTPAHAFSSENYRRHVFRGGLGLPNATLAINNLADELDAHEKASKQAQDGKEEKTRERSVYALHRERYPMLNRRSFLRWSLSWPLAAPLLGTIPVLHADESADIRRSETLTKDRPTDVESCRKRLAENHHRGGAVRSGAEDDSLARTVTPL